MPELPEVETTRRGITPAIQSRTVTAVIVRNRALRWPVPANMAKTLAGRRVHDVERRGKYLLIVLDRGTLILHLGMSGSLRITSPGSAPEKHDHVDIVFDNGCCLRFRDPRRFGSIHYTAADPRAHHLLASIGREPLDEEFNGDYLHDVARNRRQSIKTLIMDGRIVAGIGNIYANEALFLAGIHPRRAAGRVALRRCRELAGAVKQVLTSAIGKGGTTLRDFTSGAGQPGYFRQQLNVYGREGEACKVCGSPIRETRIGQRSTFYCVNCQT